jgi:phage terminase large subunit
MIEAVEYKGLELFKNPSELVAIMDPAVKNGDIKLHPWQLRLHRDFAVPSTADKPYMGALRAANGSGKDKLGIAPCAVWLLLNYACSNSIVTSSSGGQLDRQTDTYINQLCLATNRYLGDEITKCNYREYRSKVTGGVIDLFATDEPGKAEGAHPIVHNGQMGIFISEAKSITDSIFEALTRCNGFTKRLDVSSPGIPAGHFYDVCTRAEELGWRQYHVTAFDCPHLSRNYIQRVRALYGEASVLYKSMVLAEFGSNDGELIVLFPDKLHRLMRVVGTMEHFKSEFNIGGLDLSAGGDETVLVVRNGNKVIAMEGFRLTDTTKTILHLEGLFRKYELTSENSPVYTDAGGLGKPMIDTLRDRGWKNVQYVMNQWEPRDKIAYANLGTENWFRLARLVEEMEIILPNSPKDEVLEKQLCQRYYKIAPQSTVFILENKQQARAKGHPSPDRADALALCFSNYKPTYVSRERRVTQNVPVSVNKAVVTPTLRELAVVDKQAMPVVKQPTLVEWNRLNSEINLINSKLKGYFFLKQLEKKGEELVTNE